MLQRIAQCIGLACLVMVARAASETDDDWIRGVYTGGSPRPVQVAEDEGWQRAAEIAENTPGAFVLMGTGLSMQPLYRPGTILVLRQLAFTDLKRGQTALYRSKEHHVVAHVLVAKTRDGWRARGLNNRIHDMEPVQADNLVGVVVAAFQPVGHSRSGSLAVVSPAIPRAVN